ncbi:MAG: T9SS type A sorting domain-containing protein [Chitinophagaceae bacterium]|nr:MAG: T9SS type A sorting domain-containing protein [Chitinophagaceae bacterium]
MNMKKFLLFGLLVGTLSAQAQNNPIFNGGGSDGWDKKAYQQAANAIYVGGSSDGWSTANYLQTPNAVFKGGAGDGWTVATYLQAGNAIFAGGQGDGWAWADYLQAGNAIFVGGAGDGWSYTNFLQAGNGIFAGGQGDGWASTYRPLGVLPVTMVSFTAEKQQLTSLLKWQTSTEINTASFEVERSSDAVRFTKIGVVVAAVNSSSPKDYRFVDQQPYAGPNYYRLRQVDRNGAFVYTPTRLLMFDNYALQKLKAYPVPAVNLLTIELPLQVRNADVVVNLSNALGVMVRQVKLTRNNNTSLVLSLAGLPAGAYTLQVSTQAFNSTQVIVKQ